MAYPWTTLNSKGYLLLVNFFLVYYVAFYVWGVTVLALLIYVFTNQENDDALLVFVAEYHVYIRGLDIIVGFAFSAVIRAVRANVQRREQRFAEVMKRVYVMLPEVASIIKHLPRKTHTDKPSQKSIAALFYTLIDTILESEDMPELCSAHHKSQSDYVALRHAPADARVAYQRTNEGQRTGMYFLLGQLKAALLVASMANAPDIDTDAVVVRSEMRGVVFAQLWKYLKRLDEQYVSVPQPQHVWAHNQPVDVVDSFMRAVIYIYLVVRPLGLVTVASPEVWRLFVAAAWYALVVVFVLGLHIINSWYELLYNGTAITILDVLVKDRSTPIASYVVSDQTTYRMRSTRDLWRKYARRLVEAGDLAFAVSEAIDYFLQGEGSAPAIETLPAYSPT